MLCVYMYMVHMRPVSLDTRTNELKSPTSHNRHPDPPHPNLKSTTQTGERGGAGAKRKRDEE